MFALRCAIVAICLSACAQTTDVALKSQLVLGGGGAQGSYNAAVHEICEVVNARQREHGIDCSTKVTKGSVSNLQALRSGSGELTMAMAGSDWQYNAFNGVSQFNDGPAVKSLRSVFALWPETVTIFAARNSGITAIADLKGKRVNIGKLDSGTRYYWEKISKHHGWNASDFPVTTTLGAREAKSALCKGEIDAYFMIVGHPSALTQETLRDCGAILVDGTGPTVDAVLSASPYFRRAEIPADWYREQSKPVPTFALGPILTASADTPDDLVYWVVKSVFDNFEAFKELHPAFADLVKQDMVQQGLTAPLHPGAIRYFEEAGLI